MGEESAASAKGPQQQPPPQAPDGPGRPDEPVTDGPGVDGVETQGPGGGASGGRPPGPEERRAREAVERTLTEADVPWESPRAGTYVVQLPGTRKLSTTCQLIVGRHTLSLNAFVVRRPDENHEAFYRWLLERNLRLYSVAYAVDPLGDVYLTGRVPLAAVTAPEVDRLLGAVAENADGSFNALLELGFASAIRKEYAWRVARGESTRNLAAFSRLTGEGEVQGER